MRIAEVARRSSLSADTLRYYEKIGILGPITKDQSGIRNYSELDLSRIHFIKCMKATGLSMEAIRYYLELVSEGEHTGEERENILVSQRKVLQEKIAELNATLEYLDQKIEIHNQN